MAQIHLKKLVNTSDFQSQLREAESHLSRRDAVLRRAIREHGPCLIRRHSRYFETLVAAIISQQISTRAADTIEARFKAIYAPARFPTAEQLLETPEDLLRGAGLSSQKLKYLRDLAEKTADGSLPLRKLARLSDAEVIEGLTAVKGIGVWTAHMFMIFSLGRLDILPLGDLGIRRAIERAYGITEPAEMEQLAERRGWRPYRSVASWYLWRLVD
jgi:DNA-3-methyladenine glycosylase II